MSLNFKKTPILFCFSLLSFNYLMAHNWKPVEGKMMTPFGKKVTVDNVWQESYMPIYIRLYQRLKQYIWACAEIDIYINGVKSFSKYIDSWRHYESVNLSQYNDYFRKENNDIVIHVNCTKGAKPFDFGIFAFKYK